MRAPQVRELAQELLRKSPAEVSLRLRLNDLDFEIKTNRPELAQELNRYYGPFNKACDAAPQITVYALETPAWDCGLPLRHKEPEPGKTKIKEEYADLPGGRLVRKRLTGMVFIFGEETNLALGPCLENPNQVINFINNRQIQWELEQGALLAHAAGVCGPSLGLAMAGRAGQGKSTLALHLMSRGVTFVSNDRLMVSRDSRGPVMTGLAKLPRINPGTALNNPDLKRVMSPEDQERFAALPEDELWALEHKYDVDIDACFGPGLIKMGFSLDLLALLDWERDAGPCRLAEVELAHHPELLASFMKEPGLFYLPPKEQAAPIQEDYLKVLAGAKVFVLSGGVDFARAADLLSEELKKS
ncbi:MAG: HprK-related kinase B [Desulfarculaceae bacterium]|nr:HprK-related kinase B [Desulfarculaceae bacterium]MCF8045948.1 HprK-related kinase B [Desulfarculaceae bacterium]MCF8063677.1 HprK-related kinase B [Desulfarculaceae bacterium]MCF8098407.1 HprK-related kinase B [Desulfarculaceae bacterium]MCF8121151.1 HprK-related kinase B [Desulfarculaceae bacterium]